MAASVAMVGVRDILEVIKPATNVAKKDIGQCNAQEEAWEADMEVEAVKARKDAIIATKRDTGLPIAQNQEKTEVLIEKDQNAITAKEKDTGHQTVPRSQHTKRGMVAPVVPEAMVELVVPEAMAAEMEEATVKSGRQNEKPKHRTK